MDDQDTQIAAIAKSIGMQKKAHEEPPCPS